MNQLACVFFFMLGLPPRSTLFPYTTLFRSERTVVLGAPFALERVLERGGPATLPPGLKAAYRPLNNSWAWWVGRSEEHTSELQSRRDLVCRLLLEKKNTNISHEDLSGIF